MQKTLSLLILVISIFYSCKSSQIGNIDNFGEYFQIEVWQNGKLLKEKNGVISLAKQPFKYKISLFKTDHVYVSNSWGKYYFDYPNDKDIFECNDNRYLKDCRFVAIKTPNEDHFNEDKDIIVGDGDYQAVWFYKKEIDWHRFDKGVKVENGIIHGEVTVENIFDADKRDALNYPENEINYKIGEIEKDIFVVFATSMYDKNMKPSTKELQREKFVLKFK